MTEVKVPVLNEGQQSILESVDELVEWGCPRATAQRLCDQAFTVIELIVDSLNELENQHDVEAKLLSNIIAGGLLNVLRPQEMRVAIYTPLLAAALGVNRSPTPEKDQ